VHGRRPDRSFVPGDRLTPWRAVGVLIADTGVALVFAQEFAVRSADLPGDLIVPCYLVWSAIFEAGEPSQWA
jgi:hypothetical protein